MRVSEIKCNNLLKAIQYEAVELGIEVRSLTPEPTAQPLGCVSLIRATCPGGNEAMCLSLLRKE